MISTPIEVKGVVLRGDDLSVFTQPPTPAVRRWTLISWALTFVGFSGFAASSSFIHHPAFEELLVSIGFLLLAVSGIYTGNAQRWRALKQAYERSPYGQTPCDYAFDARGMVQSSSVGASNFAWSQFERVVETSHGLAFWVSPIHAFIVPKRCMDDVSLSALRELVEAAATEGGPSLLNITRVERSR